MQISVEFTNEIENCTFNITIMEEKSIMDNEAIIKYKFHLCRKFLDKLLAENLISEAQRRRIEKAVIKRLADV